MSYLHVWCDEIASSGAVWQVNGMYVCVCVCCVCLCVFACVCARVYVCVCMCMMYDV